MFLSQLDGYTLTLAPYKDITISLKAQHQKQVGIKYSYPTFPVTAQLEFADKKIVFTQAELDQGYLSMKRASKILVIENDEILAGAIERCLRSDEFQVHVANSGVAGLNAARQNVPDVVIFDVSMDGSPACREMRNDPIIKDVPILFLTDEIKAEVATVWFNLAVDDVLLKPCNLDELVYRVSALLHRTKNLGKSQSSLLCSSDSPTVPLNALGDSHIIRIGDHSLDTRTYMFSSPVRGAFRLTPVQYALIFHLMSHPNKVFSTDLLRKEVWGYHDWEGSADLVRVHIKNLRQAIEENPKLPKFIKTIRGYGYTIQTEEVASAARETK